MYKKLVLGFKILDEDIVEDDEDIVIDRYLDYSFYIMKERSISSVSFFCKEKSHEFFNARVHLQ